MAFVASIAVVGVAVHTIVVVVDAGLVAVLMAIDATELTEVIGVRMAIGTRVPLTIVRTAVDAEVHLVVVEGGGVPSRGTVAFSTVRRELRSTVVRVVRSIIVRHVACVTIGGSTGIAVRVALQTARIGMRAREREARAVVVECAGLPRGFTVTGRTVQREASRYMVGIRRAVVVREVTGVTVRGSTRIPVAMALQAVSVHVRTLQREARIVVIERTRLPSRLGMTGRAVRREARSHVIRIRGPVVIGHMTSIAVRWRACIPVGMALDAVHVGVRALERKARAVMVEGAGLPRCFIMALSTIHREAGRHVVRIGGAVVVRQVARIARGRCARVAVRVALQAVHVRVRSRQREARRVVIEGRRLPGALVVARRAVRAEPGTGMVRIGRRVVIRQVARVAVRRRARVPVAVALQAVHVRVRSLQGEARVVVIERGVVPRTLIMAQRAVRGEARRHVVRVRR